MAVLAACVVPATWGKIQINTETSTATDSDTTWTLTYDPDKTVIYSSSAEITTGTDKTVLLTGGTLFLQTWGNPDLTGDINLTGDTYMGATLRVGMDYNAVNLSNLYLVDSGEIYNHDDNKSRTNPVNFNGVVTDNLPGEGAETIDTGSTLTLKNAHYYFKGGVDINNLRIENKANVTFLCNAVFNGNGTHGGKKHGLYIKSSDVTIGNGTDAVTVTTTRLEMGDESSSGRTAKLSVKANSSLIIAGSDNTEAYGSASLLLGEWKQKSSLEVSGNLLAKSAKLLVGDKEAELTIKNGGFVAIKGMGTAKASVDEGNQGLTLRLEDGGTLVLGNGGIDTDHDFAAVLGKGKIGIYDDKVNISNDLSLSSSEGTTFDTSQYVWTDNSIAAGTEGGTLVIGGVISDYSSANSSDGSVVTQTGKLVKQGNGTLELSAANTYSGGTSIEQGMVLLSANGASLGSGTVEIKNGSTLQLNYGVSLTASAITLSGDSVINMRNGNNGTLNSAITVSGAGSLKAGEYGDNTEVTGTIGGTGVLTLQQGDYDNEWEVSSQISGTLSVQAKGNVTLSGTNSYEGGTDVKSHTLKITNGAALGTGVINLDGGSLEIASSMSISNNIDMAGSFVEGTRDTEKSGELAITGGATLTHTGSLWIGNQNSVKIAKDSALIKSYVKDSITVNATIKGVGEGSTIIRQDVAIADAPGPYDVNNTYTLDSQRHTISSADVTIDSTSDVTLGNKLDTVAVTNNNTGLLKITNGDNTLTELHALKGSINVTGQDEIVLNALTIAKGNTLTVDTVAVGSAAAAYTTRNADLVATATLEGGATVAGNLDLSNANVLTLNGIGENSLVTVTGAFVLPAGTLTLGGNILDTLAGLADGTSVDVFSVGAFTLGGQAITSNLTADSGYTLDTVFKGGSADYYLGYTVGDNGGGTVYIGKVIPEPTTATLSLLALAGLAARRRRK